MAKYDEDHAVLHPTKIILKKLLQESPPKHKVYYDEMSEFNDGGEKDYALLILDLLLKC